MATKLKSDHHLEIAHVLFIDVVGYSKLLVNEQREVIEQLNQIVRKTPQFRRSEANGKLIRIPVGDGMALVFFQTPEEPVQCAMEIARALKNHPRIRLRMGVHSGPVDQVKDVNDRTNVAGAGINIARRVMDCGDAGHILLSRRVADDLAQDSLWQPHLHELGEIEVKHGTKLGIVNLYTEELGNPQAPDSFRQPARLAKRPGFAPKAKPDKGRWAVIAATVIVVSAIAVGILFWSRRGAHTPATVTAPVAVDRGGSRAAAVPEKSIAVLPFESLSRDPDNAFFADGVQDEILTDLSRIADLKVISRTSVMQYKSGISRNLREIARQLGVANVVEGSVQRSGNRVRVNAQLVDARTDRHLWAQTYDRDLADVFAIQSEIAKTIADQLQAKLSPDEKTAIERPPTSDVTAFVLYSHAKTLLLSIGFATGSEQHLLQAIDLLNEAVRRDPDFLLAYCQLAYAHDELYFFNMDHTPARLGLADAATQTALRLRPDAGEAHLARAAHLYHAYLDYHDARAEIAIARRLLPNEPATSELAGYIDRRQGRWNESLRELERAMELDPRNTFVLRQISLEYMVMRRYPEAAAVLDRALEIMPKDIDTRVGRAFVDLEWKADTRPMHAAIQSILAENSSAAGQLVEQWLNLALCERDVVESKRALAALSSNTFGLALSDAVRFNRAFGEGLIARIRGDAAAARAAFATARAQQEELVRAQPNYAPAVCVLGLIDAGLGRKEDVLREGRRAVELLPVAKDAVNGTHMIEYFAIIAAWCGEKDLALEQLATATRLPGWISYGYLQLHPFWDPLRGDPCFEKLVEEAKKPVVLK
jgi:TolB-like protein/class 3 adenylate cyclase/Tfp pilus assembly protein PilF